MQNDKHKWWHWFFTLFLGETKERELIHAPGEDWRTIRHERRYRCFLCKKTWIEDMRTDEEIAQSILEESL